MTNTRMQSSFAQCSADLAVALGLMVDDSSGGLIMGSRTELFEEAQRAGGSRLSCVDRSTREQLIQHLTLPLRRRNLGSIQAETEDGPVLLIWDKTRHGATPPDPSGYFRDAYGMRDMLVSA